LSINPRGSVYDQRLKCELISGGFLFDATPADLNAVGMGPDSMAHLLSIRGISGGVYQQFLLSAQIILATS
jgi:hypothetical protein